MTLAYSFGTEWKKLTNFLKGHQHNMSSKHRWRMEVWHLGVTLETYPKEVTLTYFGVKMGKNICIEDQGHIFTFDLIYSGLSVIPSDHMHTEPSFKDKPSVTRNSHQGPAFRDLPSGTNLQGPTFRDKLFKH